MTEKNLIRVYTGATSEKRIDIIIKNYTKFIGIVDGYTDGLRYMIECEKESSHQGFYYSKPLPLTEYEMLLD